MEALFVLFVVISLISRVMNALSRKAEEDARRNFRPDRAPAERRAEQPPARPEPVSERDLPRAGPVPRRSFEGRPSRPKKMQQVRRPEPEAPRLEPARPVPAARSTLEPGTSMEMTPAIAAFGAVVPRAAQAEMTVPGYSLEPITQSSLVQGIIMAEVLGRPKSAFAPKRLSLLRRWS